MARTKHYFANPRIKIQEKVTRPSLIRTEWDQTSSEMSGLTNVLSKCEVINEDTCTIHYYEGYYCGQKVSCYNYNYHYLNFLSHRVGLVSSLSCLFIESMFIKKLLLI